jgi:acyl-CoA hydrolase
LEISHRPERHRLGQHEWHQLHEVGAILEHDDLPSLRPCEELPEVPSKPLSEIARRIGAHVAGLVENGSTLQAGIGQVPDACLAALRGHKYLGLHSEMWSDHALSLIESGAIDNSQKRVHPGKCVSTFVTGSKRLYDFIHDNPSVIQLEASYVNLPNLIARNPKVVAINSCVEIDLTGQVCADSIGPKVISGVGGQRPRG